MNSNVTIEAKRKQNNNNNQTDFIKGNANWAKLEQAHDDATNIYKTSQLFVCFVKWYLKWFDLLAHFSFIF